MIEENWKGLSQQVQGNTNSLGSIGPHCLANQLTQGQCQAIGIPNRPDTVRSLLELAHGRLTELEHEIVRLGELLFPVRESIPSPECAQKAPTGSDPECISLLRALCDRISHQAAHVRLIADETRI